MPQGNIVQTSAIGNEESKEGQKDSLTAASRGSQHVKEKEKKGKGTHEHVEGAYGKLW